MLGAVSLGYFALLLKVKLTCDQGLCPLDTHHPLKSVDVNFNFVQLFSITYFFNRLNLGKAEIFFFIYQKHDPYK